MKNTTRLIITVVLSMLVATVSAQVKQVFQVFDYDTQKPLAGATNVLFGQALTTNAQGIAVANLPADKKGAFLPEEYWQLDGYSYLGHWPSSFYHQFYQSKDTIKCYMVDSAKYYAAIDQAFGQLYRFLYNEAVMPVSKEFVEAVKEHPERAIQLGSELVDASLSRENEVRYCIEDAGNINHYDLYQFTNPQFQEVFQTLQTGDVNKAVAQAKSHLNFTDNSRDNLEWVNFYRELRDLYASSDDEDSVYKYSEFLYKNHYSPVQNVFYVQDLNRNGLFDKADSVCAIERKNEVNPRYAAAFEPYPLRYVLQEENPAKLKTLAENVLVKNKKACQQFPYSHTFSNMAWAFKNNYLFCSVLEDSVLASQSMDSCLYYKQKYVDACRATRLIKNQYEIRLDQYLLDYINVYPGNVPQTTIYQLYDEVYNLSKENYLMDTASLLLKAQLAENALLYLKNAPEVEGTDAKRMEVINQLADINFSLSKDFPEFYAVQNVQVTSQLVGNCLMSQADNEQTLEAYRKYERSFDVINALYPNAFIDIYLRYNRALEGFLSANQQFVLTSELSAFTDRLLSIQAGNDPQKILVAKAENANKTAESLYQDEVYDEAITYYLQSNEFYEKAMVKDEKLWIPYLTNYLQMGDAYLYQNQYDKAMMTYQQILDFEPQIPASVIPQYTQLKGSVYYYVGDIYKTSNDLKRAEKEYKTAEKYYKASVAMGNKEAYQQLGEMYWGKAVIAYQQDNLKKCKQLLEQSVGYYEAAPAERPLMTYARAKSVLKDFYKEEKNAEKYYKTVADLTDFYRKYVEYSQDFPLNLVQNAEIMLNSGTITKEQAIVYSKDMLNGLLYMNEAGEDVELAYLRGLFNMARVYTLNDSIQEAIGLYRDCLAMNEVMYKDTAETAYKSNMAEIYNKLAACYEQMAEKIDTAHSELWFYQAIDTRDTLIALLEEMASDGDVQKTYRAARQYKDNAMVFYHLDMYSSAQEYLDKSNKLLLMLYNSEYKTEVEEEVILNYYIKGVIYAENNNEEKALENFRIAVDYGDKADTSEGVSRYYFMAVNDLLEHLKKDPSADASEISKLTKKQKGLAKWFR